MAGRGCCRTPLLTSGLLLTKFSFTRDQDLFLTLATQFTLPKN